ncbi:hypothetical protein HPB51_017302 [Rhipicephalus microplus]|uniref:Peptidase M13 C-terminal domain-containing protein n=1 Tax=Rhipicephalus microplus TaxID=6941 RepID=A0A9J6EU35_RHIMP|nr:hypothetical protein HPB51_017302 [Rhipicephalus microplus]
MALMLLRKLANNPSKEDVEQLCTLAAYKPYRHAFLKEFNDTQILQTLDKTKVKGDHVLRTVAADNVLVPVLHRVLKTSLYLHKSEVINYMNLEMSLANLPDIDTDKLFFLMYGQTLCEPHEDTARALSEALWPPARITLNTALANYPEFAKAFKCGSRTAMNPKKRCSVFDFEW